MSETVIKVENLSKHYNLGVIGSGTLSRDLQSWWARFRRKEDPNTQIGMWDESQLDTDNSFWALKDVSFEVKQGDVLGIIGKNGAGKSTLLKILSRVTGPTSGNVKIKGRVASLLEVGTGFHPELTGRENVYLNGTILGMRKSEIDKKFDEIVDFSGVEKFIDTPVKRYSSGMYVRLAFAVAAHLEPEILIVDEVLAVGDAEFQKKCLGKMGEVSRAGRTVLFVSHNMGSMNILCNKCILLKNGRKTDEGSASYVISNYLSSEYSDDAEICYEKETNKLIQVTKITLLNSDGFPSARLDLNKSFTIQIEYQINQAMNGIFVGTSICNSNNEAIISTTDFDLNPSKLAKRKPGNYCTSVTIPPMLNSGYYYLTVGAAALGKDLYDKKNAIKFELFDSNSFVIKSGGETRRNSMLLVGLPWKDM